jgi:hypothetical protein
MRYLKFATILAALTVGAASAKAQATTDPIAAPVPAAAAARKHQNPARDSLRAVRTNMKADVAARKAARAAGDTVKMREASRAIRADRRQALRLRSRLPRKHAPRKPKP